MTVAFLRYEVWLRETVAFRPRLRLRKFAAYSRRCEACRAQFERRFAVVNARNNAIALLTEDINR